MPNIESVFPGGWQARFVDNYGGSTRPVSNLTPETPLLALQGNVPLGGTVASTIITGPYVEVRWSLPADIPAVFQWDGRVKILRRTRAFSRDVTDATATVLLNEDYSTDPGWPLATDVYDADYSLLDQPLTPGVTYYYSVFYGNAVTGFWSLSPVYGHARAWPLAQHTDTDGQPVSSVGDRLYDLLPSNVRAFDAAGDDTAYRVTQVLGRLLDAAREELDKFNSQGYNPDDVDFTRLPYIDWLLGWSTNFELPENIRRKETLAVVEIWKHKGAASAITYLLSTILGWDVKTYMGWPWVISTPAAPLLNPAVPPPGWVEVTDGVWADLVNALPFNGTPSTDPKFTSGFGTPADKTCKTPSTDGSWQNLNGVLVQISDISGVSGVLLNAAIQKAIRVLPLVLAHYADTDVSAQPSTSTEVMPAVAADDYSDTATTVDGESLPSLAPESSLLVNLLQYYMAAPPMGFTPDWPIVGSPYFVTPHSAAKSVYALSHAEVHALAYADLSGAAVLWWRADDSALALGAAVAAGADVPSHIGSNPNVPGAPLQIGGALVGGRKVLTFSGGGEHLMFGALSTGGSSKMLVGLVFNSTTGGAVASYGWPNDYTTDIGAWLVGAAPTGEVGAFFRGDAGVDSKVTLNDYSASTRVVVLEIDTTLVGTAEMLMKIMGIEPTLASDVSAANVLGHVDHQLALGVQDGLLSNPFTGWIGEVYVAPSFPGMYQALSAYLLSRWALTPL